MGQGTAKEKYTKIVPSRGTRHGQEKGRGKLCQGGGGCRACGKVEGNYAKPWDRTRQWKGRGKLCQGGDGREKVIMPRVQVNYAKQVDEAWQRKGKVRLGLAIGHGMAKDK